VPLPVALRRQAFRVAYVLLRVYWFIARPETRGVKCLLTDGDRVLLVRHTYGDRSWDLPGGAVRRRETPDRTATREMREELGVQIESWEPLGEIHANRYQHRDTVYCFHARLQAPRLSVDAGEIAAVQWFPRDALPEGLGRYIGALIGTARAA
jgi:8-oxo-dGTP pyrophosphatase MutT (NUDIX family)